MLDRGDLTNRPHLSAEKVVLTVSHDATRSCEGLEGENRTEDMPSNGGEESSNCSNRINERGMIHEEK